MVTTTMVGVTIMVGEGPPSMSSFAPRIRGVR